MKKRGKYFVDPEKVKKRFWTKVKKTESCWIWTGARLKTGYGSVRIRNKAWRTHRAVFFILGKPIPRGLHACHRCDNRLCVKPKHIFWGTRVDNMQDAIKKNRFARGKKMPHSKLNKKMVIAIRKRSESARRLAPYFGVSHQIIQKVKAREVWAHIQ